MRARHWGLLIGLGVGLFVVFPVLWKLVLVALIGAIGYAVAGVATGEIDLQSWRDRLRRK